MIGKKKTAAPTIEERLASAAATKAAALYVFEAAAADLDAARDEAREVEAFAFAEIERLQEIARAAADEAVDAEIKAENFRTFVGVR